MLQGMGLDVLSAVLRQVAPSHVVVLATGNPSKDPPGGSFWQLPQASHQSSPASMVVTLPAAASGICLTSLPSTLLILSLI